MKKRLQLKDLTVNSFVTAEQIHGGAHATCDCSLPTGRICDKACSDLCPSAVCTANC